MHITTCCLSSPTGPLCDIVPQAGGYGLSRSGLIYSLVVGLRIPDAWTHSWWPGCHECIILTCGPTTSRVSSLFLLSWLVGPHSAVKYATWHYSWAQEISDKKYLTVGPGETDMWVQEVGPAATRGIVRGHNKYQRRKMFDHSPACTWHVGPLMGIRATHGITGGHEICDEICWTVSPGLPHMWIRRCFLVRHVALHVGP